MTDVPQDCPATRAYDQKHGGYLRGSNFASAGECRKYADAMRDELLGKLAQARAEVERLNGILNEIDAAEVDYAVDLYKQKHPAPPAEEAQG